MPVKKVAIYEMKMHILKSLCQIPPYKYSFMGEVQMLRIIHTRVVPTDLIIIKERRFLCGLLCQLGRCLQAPAMWHPPGYKCQTGASQSTSGRLVRLVPPDQNGRVLNPAMTKRRMSVGGGIQG